MAEQSFQSRAGAKLLPFVAKRVFPSSWLDAGDNRGRLVHIAKQRRRLDGPRPDLVIQRTWNRATTEIDGSELHLLTPKTGSTGRLLFYCHGGAFVVGPSAIEWLFATRVASELGYDLALFDYPKVPEVNSSTIMAATMDAYELLTERYDPTQFVMTGMSAGGGLAASLMLQLARAGKSQPAACLLVSPWLDMMISHPDATSADRTDHLLPLNILRRDGELYAAERNPKDPLVSPRFMAAAEFAKMAPTVVVAGELELLLGEATEYVTNLSQAGASSTLVVEPYGQHAGVLSPTPEGSQALDRALSELKSHLLT